MAAIQIQCTGPRDANLILELYETGADGATHTLVKRGKIAAGVSVTVNTTATQFLQVHEATSDAAKPVDNW